MKNAANQALQFGPVQVWLGAKSGEKIAARDPKAGPLKPIEPAPGAYVKVKS